MLLPKKGFVVATKRKLFRFTHEPRDVIRLPSLLVAAFAIEAERTFNLAPCQSPQSLLSLSILVEVLGV